MKTPQQITHLLNKQMDRRDFLRHLAVGALMVVGGGVIAKSLGLPEKLGFGQEQPSTMTFGYGSSAYGGSSRPPLG